MTPAEAVRTPATPDTRPSPHHVQRVLWVRHWTDQLFSFALERPESFRFRSGEFVMIGLPGADGARPTLRAYSIASPAWADELEFFSIKVEGGPLTSRLQHVRPGDSVLLGKKPTGTLVLDALRPGRRLFLIGAGTGLAPWLSVARDPEVYDRFETVVVAHSVRQAADLAYRDLFEREVFDDPLVGEAAVGRLIYYPTVTREAFPRQGRITALIESGEFFRDLGLPPAFDPEQDRLMLCGSMTMVRDVAAILERHRLHEGSNAAPGDFVLERAFVG
jgi:ferredoxin--NADP+ reductase